MSRQQRVSRAHDAMPRLALVGLMLSLSLVAVSLSGCASSDPAPAPTTAKLTVTKVAYDCAGRMLAVSGTALPGEEGREIQVQVRSPENPHAPVWRIVPTNAAGAFRARGTYAVKEGIAVELTVRLAAVVAGERVFSRKATQLVTCPSTAKR